MATQALPAHQTKVSYICGKTDKQRLERAAKKAGVSMSAIISRGLELLYASDKGGKGKAA